jgi:hypothetical protein
MEAAPEITSQDVALDKANKEESFVDVSASDETVSISVDEIHAPLIAVDATGAVMSVFEERIVADTSSIDKLSPLPVETDITETAQSEMFLGNITGETPQELSLEEALIELAEIEFAGEEVRKEAAIKSVLIAKYKEPSLEPPVKIASDTTAPEILQPQEISEDVLQEPPGEEQQLKLQWWKLRKRKQKDTLPEGLDADASVVKTQTPVTAAGPAQEQEEPIELAIEEIIKSSTADPALDEILTEIDKQTASMHAVTAVESEGKAGKPVTEGQPIGLSDDAFASLSDEEKAAMLEDHNTVEVAGFVGNVNAQPNPAYKGLPISIAYALKNLTCEDPNDFMLRITVTRPDTGTVHETFETQVTCVKGTFSMGGFVIFTTSYETSTYRLTMQVVSKKTKTSHLLTDIPLEIKSIF